MFNFYLKACSNFFGVGEYVIQFVFYIKKLKVVSKNGMFARVDVLFSKHALFFIFLVKSNRCLIS
jgi:hypothetical protein